MTDTNMTDTNTLAVVMVVCRRIVCDEHMVWETYACVDNTRIMMKTGRRCCWWCVWFRVCCAVSGTTPVVVLGVLVVIVAGSRPVVLFEPGC